CSASITYWRRLSREPKRLAGLTKAAPEASGRQSVASPEMGCSEQASGSLELGAANSSPPAHTPVILLQLPAAPPTHWVSSVQTVREPWNGRSIMTVAKPAAAKVSAIGMVLPRQPLRPCCTMTTGAGDGGPPPAGRLSTKRTG